MEHTVCYDKKKPLIEQEIKAWGREQSLTEEPRYKESYIKDDKTKIFFKGYKFALDNILNNLEALKVDKFMMKMISEKVYTYLDENLYTMLSSILNEENK